MSHRTVNTYFKSIFMYLLQITDQLVLACMRRHLVGPCYTRISLNTPLHVNATGLETLLAGPAFLASNQMQRIAFLWTGNGGKN